MKKLVLSFTAICAAVSLNAQQNFVNGDFEATMTQLGGGLVYTHQTTGWGYLINAGPEASAAQGAQAVKLITTDDPTLQAIVNGPSSIIAGQIGQTYEGAFTDVADITVSFKYKTENMGSGNDVAFVQVAIYDTLATGASDDVALYFDNVAYTTDVTSWTAELLTMQATGNTGTPNMMEFTAVSSMLGTYAAGTPSVGGTLWLDEVVIGSTASVEENTLTTSVYPNPANDVLNIVASEEIANVSILGLDGKVVATSATSTVNVADLNSGMYIYEVTTTSGKVSRDSFMKK